MTSNIENKIKKIFSSFSMILVILILSMGKSYPNQTEKQQIQELRNRISRLEKQTKKLEKQALKSKNQNSINLKSLNEVKLNGFMMVDGGMVTKGDNNSTKGSISLRRLVIGFRGDVVKNWRYRAQVGFENNQASIYNAFISYDGMQNNQIVIGNMFDNNGIDAQTSSQTNSFIERSPGILTFRPLRRTGVSLRSRGENWGTQIGIFGSQPNNSNTQNKGNGVSARAYITPINNANHILHLGFNTSYRTPDSQNSTLRFTTTGDSVVINATLIDTNNIASVKDYYQNAAELRYQKNSFTLTSEYIKTNVIRKNGLDNLNFEGGYVSTSYFLTGQKIGYNIASGTPTLISVPEDGAIEIAARYSYVNLSDKDIQGGKLHSYVLGTNYYINNDVRLMADYVFNQLRSSPVQNKNPQYLMLRLQINF